LNKIKQFHKKEGFSQPFVVLILSIEKLEKTNSFGRWRQFNKVKIN